VTHFDAVIIGGGAAGLFCAFQAGRRGRRVLVVEHNRELGRKILISGGGRCNFTNLGTTPENFVSDNPHFARSALARYTPHDFVGLVRKHKIDYYEKKLSQLFCRSSARDIVRLLTDECAHSGVVIKTGCTVGTISKSDRFAVQTSDGGFTCDKLVIATGGLSFPKIGATDFGYRVAKQFGLRIVPTRASLVAMVLEGTTYPQLAGISVDAEVETGGMSFHENILFTHRGLSGPAILQISNYWKPQQDVSIDLMPGLRLNDLLLREKASRKELGTFLSMSLPQRLVRSLFDHPIAQKRLTDLGKKDIQGLSERLNNWRVRFRDTEGYDRAEVTLGGVSTDGLSSQTMECKNVPGLYFIGEVVDVTGWLGGYNFQWAWASANAAGTSL
jgi:predicted Rossmann fold flavoprotein